MGTDGKKSVGACEYLCEPTAGTRLRDFVSISASTPICIYIIACAGVVIPGVFICLHMCVLEAIVGYLCFQGKNWNEAVKPVAVTDHLLCSFSTLLVFSKQFPLQHTQRASHLLSNFPFFYAVVSHSCCTVLITYKEKPAYISKGEDESGLIICNVWVPFIGTE